VCQTRFGIPIRVADTERTRYWLRSSTGFHPSLHRAGAPTDNGYAELFDVVLKSAIVARRQYQTLGDFLRAAEAWVNFYTRERLHENLGYQSSNQFAEANQLHTLPNLAVF
jgi:putative transposase